MTVSSGIVKPNKHLIESKRNDPASNLGLPNFLSPFVIKCHASGEAIGVVLMQGSRPLAYYSQALKGKACGMSTYEKELFGLASLV